MRFLGRLIVVLLILGVVLTAVAFVLPRRVTVTREIVIDAPPRQIFPHLNALQRVADWSPWVGIDPAMKMTYAGPEQGVGNRMTWSSENRRIGSGSEVIIASIPDERVETAIEFPDMGMATAWQALVPEDDGTRVTWGMLADTGNSPVGRYLGLMMDRRVGPDFEKGLAALKVLVEAG